MKIFASNAYLRSKNEIIFRLVLQTELQKILFLLEISGEAES